MKTGTLKELDVMPGDVYESVSFGYVDKVANVVDDKVFNADGHFEWLDRDEFRIISRASDTPKTWGEMTDAEKGALLLAAHEGKVIEAYYDGVWFPVPCTGIKRQAYRIKPEPKRETVTLYGAEVSEKHRNWSFIGRGDDATHRITFDTIDGEPDVCSIKMEEI